MVEIMVIMIAFVSCLYVLLRRRMKHKFLGMCKYILAKLQASITSLYPAS